MCIHTGEKQQFGTSCSALNGGFHKRRETKLVALVNSQTMKPSQQQVYYVVMTYTHTHTHTHAHIRKHAHTHTCSKCCTNACMVLF